MKLKCDVCEETFHTSLLSFISETNYKTGKRQSIKFCSSCEQTAYKRLGYEFF